MQSWIRSSAIRWLSPAFFYKDFRALLDGYQPFRQLAKTADRKEECHEWI
jgi:hypothetical protein